MSRSKTGIAKALASIASVAVALWFLRGAIQGELPEPGVALVLLLAAIYLMDYAKVEPEGDVDE